MTREERSARAKLNRPIPTMHSLLLAAKRDAKNLQALIAQMQLRSPNAEKVAAAVKAFRHIANAAGADPRSRGIARAALKFLE